MLCSLIALTSVFPLLYYDNLKACFMPAIWFSSVSILFLALSNLFIISEIVNRNILELCCFSSGPPPLLFSQTLIECTHSFFFFSLKMYVCMFVFIYLFQLMMGDSWQFSRVLLCLCVSFDSLSDHICKNVCITNTSRRWRSYL